MNLLNNWIFNETIANSSHRSNDSFSYIDSGFFYNKNYWALLLLVLCISVVFGNVLVILSVAKERSLQNITNYFIVSLAVADLCVAGVVMPFYAYTMVGGCVVILSAGAWRGLRLLDRLQLFINKLSIVLRLKVSLGCWEENRLPVETNCANSTKCLSVRSC